MAFKMVCTGGPFGDCCSSYDVVLDKEYTVEEFIQEVLKEKPEEWGEFSIVADFKHRFSTSLDSCEYKYGKTTKGLKKTDNANARVKEIKAHGGWTAMDYFIQLY